MHRSVDEMAGMLPKFKPAAIGTGGARPAIRPLRPAPPPAPPKPPRPKRPTSGIGERSSQGSYDVGVETAQYRDPETMDAPPGMQAANVIEAARAREAAAPLRSIDELADEAAYGQAYQEPASYGQESYGLHGQAEQGAYADPSYRESFAPETCSPEDRSYYPRHGVEERRAPSRPEPEREDETRARDEDEIAQFRQAYHAGNLATPYEALPSLEARIPSRPAREERYEEDYEDDRQEQPTAYGSRDEDLETRDVLGRDGREERDGRRHESGARARPREEPKGHDESYFPEPALPPPPVRAESQFPLGVQPLRDAQHAQHVAHVPPAPPSPMPGQHAIPPTELAREGVAREGVGTNPQLVQQQLMQQQLMQQQLMQQQLMQQQLMQQQLLAQQHAQAQVQAPAPVPPGMQGVPHGLVPATQLVGHPHGHSLPPHVPHPHLSGGPMGQSMGPSMAPHGTALYGGHPGAQPVPAMRPTQAGSPRPAATAAQTVLTRAQSNDGLLAQGFLRAAKGLGRLPWFVAGVTFGIAFMFFATTLLLERGNAPQPVAATVTTATVTTAPAAHPPVAAAPLAAPVAPAPQVVAPVVQPVAVAPVAPPTVTPAALPAAPATVATYQPTYAPAPPPTGYSGDPYAAYRPPPPPPRHYAPARPAAPAAPRAPAAPAAEAPAADLSDMMNKALAP